MEQPSYSLIREVMFFDTDIGGVVHNLAYLRLIEENRTQLAFLMGMNLKEMAERSVFPVLLRTEVDYLKPATLGDELRIDGQLSSLERVRFYCNFTIYRQRDGVELVKCRQSLAIVKMPEGRPQRLPKEWFDQWA